MPNSGRDFLRRVFEGIRHEPGVEAVTLSEAMQRIPAEKLDWLASGFLGRRQFQYLDRPSRGPSGMELDHSGPRSLDGPKRSGSG